ncbi:MAG TPA: hypothetical protein VFH11_12275 [Gemmatimonadota bacterium]|nr:hypothetical protein [Gemmatimonadota bacterium]
MRMECFRCSTAALIAVVVGALWTASARAQEPAQADPAAESRGFEPRFIDTSSYRNEQVLLYDWPALTALVRWSAPVAEAVGRDDGTLSAELIQEFRGRVGELAASEPPEFIASESDSIRAVLGRIGTWLDSADSMVAGALPASIAEPTGEERPNVSDRERTYATGPTAVRVPAGIDVGEADSLPGASIDGAAGEPTYVDLVAESLAELDALVHMVRKLGGTPSEDPGSAAPRPPPDTAPGRPGP